MGFFSRLFVPRGVRRAMHPVRTAERAVTPRSAKRIRRAMHPVRNATYAWERSLTTTPRRRSNTHVYTHGDCQVRHRTAEAAARCRNR